MITIELKKDRFLAKEAMGAAMRIENTGDAPVEVPDPQTNINWQPIYTVEGPSFPQGYTFHFRGVLLGDMEVGHEGLDLVTVRLEPGQSHIAEVPLEQMATFAKPGEYTLAASMDIGGKTVRSEPVTFTIVEPVFQSFHIAVAEGFQSSYPIRVFGLVASGSTADVYMALFKEVEADVGDVRLMDLTYCAPAGKNAKQLFGARMNYTGLGTPAPRVGWRRDSTLCVIGFGEEEPKTFDPPEPFEIVRPGLMTESGDLDLFVLSEGGKVLSLVRFPDGEDAPKSMWDFDLPAEATAGRAALGPSSAGSDRVAVLIADTKKGALLALLNAGNGEAKPKLQKVVVKGKHHLPSCEPAVRMDRDGNIHASTLIVDDSDERVVQLIDLAWSPNAKPPFSANRSLAATLQKDARAGAVVYGVAERDTPRRDWAILLEDGQIVTNQFLEPRSLPGEPAVPLQLLPMSRRTYLLVEDPKKVLRLTPVR